MTFNRIILFFCVGLPVCVVARVLQITQTVDYSNGFYFNEQKTLGGILLALIIAVCVILGFIASRVETTPLNVIEHNRLMSVSAALVAVTLVVDFFAEKPPYVMLEWQAVLVKFITVLCIVYFFVLALKDYMGLKMPFGLHVIPAIYVMAKIIFTFIGVSSLAVISDNILLIAAYCALMLFFINYGKIHNGIDVGKSFTKILSSGLTASLLCLSQSCSYFIINIFDRNKYLHMSSTLMLNVFALGIFAISFTVLHYREKV